MLVEVAPQEYSQLTETSGLSLLLLGLFASSVWFLAIASSEFTKNWKFKLNNFVMKLSNYRDRAEEFLRRI